MSEKSFEEKFPSLKGKEGDTLTTVGDMPEILGGQDIFPRPPNQSEMLYRDYTKRTVNGKRDKCFWEVDVEECCLDGERVRQAIVEHFKVYGYEKIHYLICELLIICGVVKDEAEFKQKDIEDILGIRNWMGLED